MTRALPDPIISDAEVAIRVERGELVKLSASEESATDARTLAELRQRVAMSRPPRRRRRTG